MNPDADRSLNTEPCHCGSGVTHFPDAHRRPETARRVPAYAIPANERDARRSRSRAARMARRTHRRTR